MATDEAKSPEIEKTEENEMKKALASLAEQDKTAKLQKFVAHGDEIRDIKDKSSSDILRPHAYAYNNMDDDDKKNQLDESERQKYFAITSERRKRYETLMSTMDKLKFKLNKTSILQLVINNNIKFNITTTVTNAKPYRNEPTVWYLETIMPGKPDNIMKYWGQSQYRLKWDTSISSHTKKELWENKERTSFLHIVNHQTKPAVGGLVSPRQFTTLVRRWNISGGMELAAQSIKYKDFPTKKGFVDAFNNLYGQKIIKIDEKELKNKYGVPEIKVNNEVLTWCKCEYMIQTDIKGWLPTKVVESAVAGGCINTYDMCRQYILKDVCGLKIVINKIQ